MNSHLQSLRAAGLLLPGLLAALSGCATGSLRQSTRLEPPSGLIPQAVLAANVQAPVPLNTVKPQYPYELRRSGVHGTVHVVCVVDEAGRVHDATARETTHDWFSQPAVDAVRQWTFQPGRRDGQPIAMRVSIPVQFTFED